MRRSMVIVLGMALLAAGTVWAADKGEGGKASVTGYFAPNFRMIDKGEGKAADLGFGMAFNRVTFSGEAEAGKIVKSIGWVIEAEMNPFGTTWAPERTDSVSTRVQWGPEPKDTVWVTQVVPHAAVKTTDAIKLQWAYVQPKFNDVFSVRFGNLKKSFSREVLHATGKLLTVDRTVAAGYLEKLGYVNFNFGLEAVVTHSLFKLQAGGYSGFPSLGKVDDQDPGLDFGARGIVMPMKGLEIGVNAMSVALPERGNNKGDYDDTPDEPYRTNSAMAFGFDADYAKSFGTMSLRAQVEYGTGENWLWDDPSTKDTTFDPKDYKADQTWEDYSWYSFQYYHLKALFMATPDLGIHFAYSVWDPNTDSIKGKNDVETWITPGVVYYWSKNLRTQAEVQMQTVGKELEDFEYTHFVVQQVLIW